MALRDTIKKQMEILAEDAKEIVRTVMESEMGINEKTGTNTLIGSNIYNELEAMTDSDNLDIIRILVNDYIDYIEGGRSAGTFPPPSVIANWCQRKGIPSDNRTVYLICRSICENGIAPRPLFEGDNGVWAFVDAYIDDWCDMLFNTLTEHLDNYFNNN